jgi:hypothetical protein
MHVKLFVTAIVTILSALSADAAEIKLLDGTTLSGDVVALDAASLRIVQNGQERTIPFKDLMAVDWGTSSRPPTRVPYLRIRLVDGSLLYCLSAAIKETTVEARLLSGQPVGFPLDALHHLACDAQDAASLQALEAIIAEAPAQDVVRVLARDGSTVDPYEGTILRGSGDGNRLAFKAQSLENVSNIDVARLRGLYFSRKQAGLGAQAIGRVYDVFGNCITAISLELNRDECRIATANGFLLVLPRAALTQLDLTPGKLAYLSDLEPLRVEETPILADLYHYRRDKNLEGGPLSVGRRVYPKGLALHSKSILEYDVAGYSSFRCILGLDDAMAGPAHAVVRIEGDAKELLSTILSSRDNKPQEVSLSIKGVRTLRLIVDYGEDLDLGDHVDFADARIIK